MWVEILRETREKTINDGRAPCTHCQPSRGTASVRSGKHLAGALATHPIAMGCLGNSKREREEERKRREQEEAAAERARKKKEEMESINARILAKAAESPAPATAVAFESRRYGQKRSERPKYKVNRTGAVSSQEKEQIVAHIEERKKEKERKARERRSRRGSVMSRMSTIGRRLSFDGRNSGGSRTSIAGAMGAVLRGRGSVSSKRGGRSSTAGDGPKRGGRSSLIGFGNARSKSQTAHTPPLNGQRRGSAHHLAHVVSHWLHLGRRSSDASRASSGGSRHSTGTVSHMATRWASKSNPRQYLTHMGRSQPHATDVVMGELKQLGSKPIIHGHDHELVA